MVAASHSTLSPTQVPVKAWVTLECLFVLFFFGMSSPGPLHMPLMTVFGYALVLVIYLVRRHLLYIERMITSPALLQRARAARSDLRATSRDGTSLWQVRYPCSLLGFAGCALWVGLVQRSFKVSGAILDRVQTVLSLVCLTLVVFIPSSL